MAPSTAETNDESLDLLEKSESGQNEQQAVRRSRLELRMKSSVLPVVAILLIFVSATVARFSRVLSITQNTKEAGIGLQLNTDLTLEDNTYFFLWTYPTPPPQLSSAEIESAASGGSDIILCSYSYCMEEAKNKDLRAGHINLRELASNLPRYSEFVKNQMWYKIVHGKMFPHHVQAVAILSLLHNHPNSCVRTIGQERAICGNDVHFYNYYDPKVPNVEPPFFLSGLDFKLSFDMFDFGKRIKKLGYANIGDEVQAYSGLQFMPYLSDLVDSQELPAEKGHLFANGRYMTKLDFNNPIEELHTTMFSLQFGGDAPKSIRENISFFEFYNTHVGAVGAKDSHTLKFLRENGIQSYLSSCFSTMINMGYENNLSKKRKLIVAVDVVRDLLPEKISDKATFLSFDIINNQKDQKHRYDEANKLLQKIGNEAKVVITSSIDMAFPALAQGVPVIYVDRDDLKVDKDVRGLRIPGVKDLFHTYNPIHEWNFDIDNMGTNPGVHKIDRYRASFWNNMKKQSSLYKDTAHLFGLVPMKRLGHGIPAAPEPLHDEFHFIYTTPEDTITWRVKRAIEAVFFHHPNAKVIMHSKTIPKSGSILDIFKETGYDFRIQSYQLEDLLIESPTVSDNDVNKILDFLPDRRKNAANWYSHETDLVRMLILEVNGGVYLDTDQHLVRSIPKSVQNSIGWQDPHENMVNGAIMIFEKGNEFLSRVIKDAVHILIHGYATENWGIIGPNLLTATYKEFKKNHMEDVVDVKKQRAFYPYFYGIVQKCFEEPAENLNPIHKTETYTVHLNTKMSQKFHTTKAGTVCDSLLHDYCIFCDEIYTEGAQQQLS